MTQAFCEKLSWKIQSRCGQRVGSLTGAAVTSLPPQIPLSALLLDWKMGRANREPLLRTQLVKLSTKPASCSSPRTAEGAGSGSRRGGNGDRQGGQRITQGQRADSIQSTAPRGARATRFLRSLRGSRRFVRQRPRLSRRGELSQREWFGRATRSSWLTSRFSDADSGSRGSGSRGRGWNPNAGRIRLGEMIAQQRNVVEANRRRHCTVSCRRSCARRSADEGLAHKAPRNNRIFLHQLVCR